MDYMSVFEPASQLDPFKDDTCTNIDDTGYELSQHCLACHGEIQATANIHDLSVDSLLKSGEIRILFSNSAYHAKIINTNDCSIQLFGHDFDPGLAMLEKQVVLFQMARKCFLLLESDALKINSNIALNLNIGNYDYFKLRQQLCAFFSFIRSLLSIPSNTEYSWLFKEIVPTLLTQLCQWRLLLQGFTKLPHYVINNCSSKLGNKCTLASHHLFHSHLELRWYHLNVLYALVQHEIAGNSQAKQSLESDLILFMSELIHLTEGCFTTAQGLDKFFQNSPFPCTCVREIWLLLQIFTDKMSQENHISQPFWGLVEKLVRSYISGKTQSKEPVIADCSELSQPILGKECKDRPTLCLWLYFHFVRLYGYSESGLYLDILRIAPLQESSAVLEVILQSSLPNNEELKEAKLREVLKTLLLLPTWWPTGTSPLLILWEVFLRRINSPFNLPTEPLSSLAIMNKSASGFASQLKDNLKISGYIDDSENSFSLFLKLLGHQIGVVSGNEDIKQKAWNLLKGRIYSKFPETRMQTMSELGLYHLTSLLITMALAVDLEEVGGKMQQMLGLCKARDSGKRAVIWRAHLALLLLRAEQSRDLAICAEPMMRLVEEACGKMSQFNNPETDLMRTYIEALQDIADASPNGNISLHVLIGGWLAKYFAVCGTTDTCRALDAMQALANKMETIAPLQISHAAGHEIFDNLKKYLLPILIQESQTPNPPAQKIADLGVTLTLAADNTDFTNLFTHFVTSDNVNVRITVYYLAHILPNKDAMDRTKTKILNYHNLIIQAWVKCCLLPGESRNELLKLTKVVAQLPQLSALCGGNTDLIVDTNEPLDALAQTLAARFQSLQNIREKQMLKEQTLACLGRIDKVAEAALKYGKLSTALTVRLYQNIGSLVESCPLLLYNKSQVNCLMKGLISHLLLPMSIRNIEVKLSTDVAAALKYTLPMFMRGIVSLGPKTDPYVARTIRELTEQYVPRLSSSEHGVQHPLIVCLEGKSDLSFYILDSMRVLFFMKKARLLPHGATQALQLIQQMLLQKYDDVGLIEHIVNVLLESLLLLMLYLEEKSQDKHRVAETVKEIVTCDAFKDTPAIQAILDTKLTVVYRNLGFHSAALFRLLQWLATIRSGLLRNSMPALRAEIAKVENMRGTGRDSSLRNSLEKLESQLGIVSMET